MDPNATLESLRDCLIVHRTLPDGEDHDDLELDVLRDIADRAEALDDWLSKGGFLPAAWER